MRRGAQEIMDHPWFASLNFTELYNKTVSTRVLTKALTKGSNEQPNLSLVHGRIRTLFDRVHRLWTVGKLV